MAGFLARKRARKKAIDDMMALGVLDYIKDTLYSHMGYLLRNIGYQQGDKKHRHYVLLIFTNEGTDDHGDVVVSTDCVTSLSLEDSRLFTAEWLEGQRQSGS
jgi:hypothetical protein